MRTVQQRLEWWAEHLRSGASTDFTCMFRNGPFLIRKREGGGVGPCFSGRVLNGRFDDADDALGWLRFEELPHLIWLNAGGQGEPIDFDVAHPECYFTAEGQPDALALIRILDATIDAETKGPPDFDAVRSAWNNLFACGNPESELIAMGGLTTVIAAGVFNEWLDDFVDYQLDEETDEDEYKKWSALRDRIKSGNLDPDDPEQSELVQRLLEATLQY